MGKGWFIGPDAFALNDPPFRVGDIIQQNGEDCVVTEIDVVSASFAYKPVRLVKRDQLFETLEEDGIDLSKELDFGEVLGASTVESE